MFLQPDIFLLTKSKKYSIIDAEKWGDDLIYITGDVHCPYDVQKLNTRNFPEQKKMTKDDILIVCGDMGIVWYNAEDKRIKEDKYWQKWFNNKPFTTVFVDGNHENFIMLQQYPIVEFHGGLAHKISDKVYHLIRGEVFEFDGQKFFCFGGASSHDKESRIENISWWSEELPNDDEMANGLENLKKVNFSVDYIISHCCPTSIQKELVGSDGYKPDVLTDYFEEIANKCVFKKWFFGHYHVNREVHHKYCCIYDEKVKI